MLFVILVAAVFFLITLSFLRIFFIDTSSFDALIRLLLVSCVVHIIVLNSVISVLARIAW